MATIKLVIHLMRAVLIADHEIDTALLLLQLLGNFLRSHAAGLLLGLGLVILQLVVLLLLLLRCR